LLSVVTGFVHSRAARTMESRLWPRMVAGLLAVVGVGFCFANARLRWVPDFQDPRYFQLQCLRAAPSACWAIALSIIAATIQFDPQKLSLSKRLACLTLAATLATVYWHVHHGGLSVGARALCGFGLMLSALAPWRGAAVRTLARWGQLSYGVYLSHVLIVEVLHVITTRALGVISPASDLVTFIAGFCGALMITATLSRTKRLAWLAGATG